MVINRGVSIEVLSQLGVDISFFHQFVIVIVVFIILDRLLWRKVLKIYYIRHDLTETKNQKINEKKVEYKILQDTYEKKLKELHDRAHGKYNRESKNIQKRERERLSMLEIKYEKLYSQGNADLKKKYDNILLEERKNIEKNSEELIKRFYHA